MTTMPRQSPESSVTFSLKELVDLENQRVAEEHARAARERRAENERIAARRAEEERARCRDEAEREEREREATLRRAAEQAAIEGRANAMRDIARVEAEAKVRLAADEALRAHELAMLREKLTRRAVLAKTALGALLGVSIVASGFLAVRSSARETELAGVVATLESERRTLTTERDDARSSETRATEGQSRAVDNATRERAQRVRALEHAEATLVAWASERRRPEVVSGVTRALASARRDPTDAAILATEQAIDEARAQLAAAPKKPGAVTIVDRTTGPACVDKNDPLCGLNGRGL